MPLTQEKMETKEYFLPEETRFSEETEKEIVRD